MKKRKTIRATKSRKKAMLESDVYTDTLDAALTAAEGHLQKLLRGFPPRQIAQVFSDHVMTHATEELSNIAKHGHRNDDPADKPQDRAAPGLTNGEIGIVRRALRFALDMGEDTYFAFFPDADDYSDGDQDKDEAARTVAQSLIDRLPVETDAEEGDDLCDVCMTSGVHSERTTYCGKTIGVECGCEESHADGTCGNPDCEDCREHKDE